MLYGPDHLSTIELISGHLASTTYFSRKEVLNLYNAVAFPRRLELLTSYMKRYTSAMLK